MDEQRVREIVREEIAKALPIFQANLRADLAADFGRPSALRHGHRGHRSLPERAHRDRRPTERPSSGEQG